MQYDILIRTKTLLETVKEVLEGTPCKVFFYRFKGDWGDPGLQVADLDKSPWKEYNEGGYSVIYISKGRVPPKPTDLKFLDREESRLIELRGGRQEKKALEKSMIRPFAKKSEMDSLFKKLTSRLDKVSTKGALLDGHPYPKIRVEADIGALELYLSLGSKGTRVEPMNPA